MHAVDVQKQHLILLSQMGGVPPWDATSEEETFTGKGTRRSWFFPLYWHAPSFRLHWNRITLELGLWGVFCLLLVLSFLVRELKTSKQNPNRLQASCYICIQHLQPDLNKAGVLFRISSETKQTSEELEDTPAAHTNNALNKHRAGLGDPAPIPGSAWTP